MIANWIMDKEKVRKSKEAFLSKAKETKDAVLDWGNQLVKEEWFLVILLGALAGNALINNRKK